MEQNTTINGQFNYTYSASEQEEVNKIREKYVAKEETKMDRLRRLDKAVEKPGRNAAIILGVIGTLVMGAGMSCVMELASSMELFILGVAVGIIGMVMVGLAYPLYQHITRKERAKVADEILALTEEISLN